MLNISPNNRNEIDERQFVSYQNVNKESSNPKLKRTLYIIGAIILIIMLLPWTQNIRSNGKITTLRPEQRPQTINSILAGRIETWFVKDGDFVKKGDTIVVISEVKDGYFDPKLVDRTQNQIKNKELSVISYEQKVIAFVPENYVPLPGKPGEVELKPIKILTFIKNFYGNDKP
mgnify:CR=1 FL=1